jgi:hypothetical protein
VKRVREEEVEEDVVDVVEAEVATSLAEPEKTPKASSQSKKTETTPSNEAEVAEEEAEVSTAEEAEKEEDKVKSSEEDEEKDHPSEAVTSPVSTLPNLLPSHQLPSE